MNHDIITGQYVRIEQTPASLGERFFASLLDFLFMGGALLCFIYSAEAITLSLPDAVYFLFSLPILLYTPLFEMFNDGQTPGKRILNMRVIRTDGTVPTLGSYLLRWLLSPIDWLMVGCVGAVSILVTSRHQRLGDLAAGTMVIKEKNYHHIGVSLEEFSYLTPDYRPTFPQAADLSLEQVNIIERTLHTASKDRPRRIALLARKVTETLRLPARRLSDEKLLETLLCDYQYYALEESDD